MPDMVAGSMGFHIPPFNSVNHLHMHIFALPFVSGFRTFEFAVKPGQDTNHKGFSWFVNIEQTIAILEDGKRVGVMSI